jgi:hypothetical protein
MELFKLNRKCVFSDDRRYRYLLTIENEDVDGGIVNFLMLNPSTADEIVNDPTVERCQRRAFEHGLNGRIFRSVIVTNLFGYRSTDPHELKKVDDPVGPENDGAILQAAQASDLVICAWGEHGARWKRAGKVVEMLRGSGFDLHALKLNTSGHPAHPLYIPYDVQPFVWNPQG